MCFGVSGAPAACLCSCCTRLDSLNHLHTPSPTWKAVGWATCKREKKLLFVNTLDLFLAYFPESILSISSSQMSRNSGASVMLK